MKPISAVIVSYNDRDIMSRCVEALAVQMTVPGDEIIIVDNGSTDGVLEDLRGMADTSGRCSFILIENGENAGFPVGCNIGFASAAPGNDIFLLNNDAVLAEGALDNLSEALYSADDIGAVGAVSNNALEQTVEGMARDMTLDDALKKGAEPGSEWTNTTKLRRSQGVVAEPGRGWKQVGRESAWRSPYEYRSRLTGFAVLIKRSVVDMLVREDGYFLDPRFSPGYFEDEDLGVRIALAGYRQILCHNAFIYHKGGTGFASHPEAMERGRQKFIDKWGFDVWAYIGILYDYEKALAEYSLTHSGPFRILELNCGMGVNLAHLKYRYPHCTVIGIESDPVLARIAAQLIDVICENTGEAFQNALTPGTPEAEYLPAGSFDIIFAWDACERSADPESLRAGLRRLLKPDGLLVDSC